MFDIDFRILLTAAAAAFLWLKMHIMHFFAVLKQINVAVKTLVTASNGALEMLALCVPPVVLPPVATRRESFVTKLAFVRFFTSVHPFVHLKVRLVLEHASAWNLLI